MTLKTAKTQLSSRQSTCWISWRLQTKNRHSTPKTCRNILLNTHIQILSRQSMTLKTKILILLPLSGRIKYRCRKYLFSNC